MKRLRDELHEDDPRARVAARLIRSIAPLPEDPQRQRRVRLQLGSPRPQSVVWLPLVWLSRPVVVLTTLLATVGVAGAMAGGGWSYARQQVAQLFSGDSAPEVKVQPAPVRRPARVRIDQASEAPRPSAELLPPPPESDAPASVPAPPTAAAPPERREQRPDPRRKFTGAEKALASPPPLGAGAAVIPTGPGASLMIEAMQARRAGDPARTERLLTRYRTEYPNGELQEEALVLSLEAATQLGSDRAEALARTYLARFPSGRFRDRVQQMLSAKGR